MNRFTLLKLNSWRFFLFLHSHARIHIPMEKNRIWIELFESESNGKAVEKKSCWQFAMQRAQNDMMATSVRLLLLSDFLFFSLWNRTPLPIGVEMYRIQHVCIAYTQIKGWFFRISKRIRILLLGWKWHSGGGGNTSRKFTSVNFISTTPFHNECNNSFIWCNVTPNVQFSWYMQWTRKQKRAFDQLPIGSLEWL